MAGQILKPCELSFHHHSKLTISPLLPQAKSAPSKTQARPVGVKIPTCKITLRETFLTSPEELYRVFTNQEVSTVLSFQLLASAVQVTRAVSTSLRCVEEVLGGTMRPAAYTHRQEGQLCSNHSSEWICPLVYLVYRLWVM